MAMATIEALDAIVDGDSVQGFGGILRCETCGRWQPVGDTARYMRTGWPKCHGYTMRWWTQRQLDAGEMPILELGTS